MEKRLIVDLCKHPFKEFKEEMGDVQLGFSPSFIMSLAKRFFAEIHVNKAIGIRCECSGRYVELFIAYLLCSKS